VIGLTGIFTAEPVYEGREESKFDIGSSGSGSFQERGSEVVF
jgi:hypothetical protein